MVQKRLLVQYGSLPPGDCDPLEFLMRDTHRRLIKSAHEIIENKDNVCRYYTTYEEKYTDIPIRCSNCYVCFRAGCSLTTMGNLIIYIFKQTPIEKFKIKLIEEMLCLSSLHENHQVSK